MNKKAARTGRSQESGSKSDLSVSRQPFNEGRCQFPFADGRCCRLPRARDHKSLCIFHARAERELLSSAEAARCLASFSGEFKTTSEINRVLGQLFSLLAQKRIPRRDADSLAYIAQLLLQTLPQVREEIRRTLGIDAWENTLQRALTAGEPQSQANRQPQESRPQSGSPQPDNAKGD
jgi:hypothetical protein